MYYSQSITERYYLNSIVTVNIALLRCYEMAWHAINLAKVLIVNGSTSAI